MAEILTNCVDCGVEVSVPVQLFEVKAEYRCLLHTLDWLESNAQVRHAQIHQEVS